jgi:hypothetical protein
LRKYLLKTLPAESAERIEERYFVDNAFFQEIRAAELELICDYLDGHLSEQEREQFENHYLRVNSLRQLVEEIRARRNIPRAMMGRRLRFALAGAAFVMILGLATWRYQRARTAAGQVQIASSGSASQDISLELLPDIAKGAGASSPEIILPDHPQTVSLTLVLPVQASSAFYTVRILNPDLEGNARNVWSGGGFHSTPRTGGQEVVVKLSSASLPPGDYVLELDREDGHFQESYVFRAIKGQTR